jgi:DNA-directed RNA polymerase subunit K/omega
MTWEVAVRLSSERALRIKLYSPELHVMKESLREILGRAIMLIDEGCTLMASGADEIEASH